MKRTMNLKSLTILCVSVACLAAASCNLTAGNDSALSIKVWTRIDADINDYNRTSHLYISALNTDDSNRQIRLTSASVTVNDFSSDPVASYSFGVGETVLAPGESVEFNQDIYISEYWEIPWGESALSLTLSGVLEDPEGFWDPEEWTWTASGIYKHRK